MVSLSVQQSLGVFDWPLSWSRTPCGSSRALRGYFAWASVAMEFGLSCAFSKSRESLAETQFVCWAVGEQVFGVGSYTRVAKFQPPGTRAKAPT